MSASSDAISLVRPDRERDHRERTSPSVSGRIAVIVSPVSDVVASVERVLASGDFGVIFVESATHAYSQIKRIQPSLVVLCVRLTDPEDFQVLSMLKMDPETRSIPVMTFAIEYERLDSSDAADPEEEEEAASSDSLIDVRRAGIIH